MSGSVFVSGATGYIAQHIVKQLIEQGYRVVGSVRTIEKGEKLKKHLGSDNFGYEIVEDLSKEGVFDEPLKRHPETTIFLHTASPVNFGVDNCERDLIIPALRGTTGALKAIKAHAPQIQKVVVTSSFAAINSLASPRAIKEGTVNESSWTNITYEEAVQNNVCAYAGSKTLAERAAWEFLEKEKPKFSLTTVNPAYVLGPQAFDDYAKGQLNFSAGIVSGLFGLKTDDPIPKYDGGFIDVRDVARAHITAMVSKQTDSKRLLLYEKRYTSQLILNILRDNFLFLHDRLPVGNPTDTNSKVTFEVDNTATRELLTFPFISLEQSVIDSAKQYLDVNNLGH